MVALELHEEACEVCRLSSVCMRPGECVLEVGIDMFDSIVPGNPVVIRDAGCSASRMMPLAAFALGCWWASLLRRHG